MAALLDSYEQQYATITASITAKTAKLASASLGEDRKAVITLIEKEIEEARDILEQMGLEVRELPSASRLKYQTRIQSYMTEFSRLENEFKKAKNSYQKAREELLGEYDNQPEDFQDQKRRLIENGEKLERSNKRLDVGYRVALETEQVGTQILSDLNQQREVIQRTRNRLRETDEDLSMSGRLLNRMVMRIMQNRLLILGLSLLILIIIIIGVYFSFRKHN